jgi:hypothetical protein
VLGSLAAMVMLVLVVMTLTNRRFLLAHRCRCSAPGVLTADGGLWRAGSHGTAGGARIADQTQGALYAASTHHTCGRGHVPCRLKVPLRPSHHQQQHHHRDGGADSVSLGAGRSGALRAGAPRTRVYATSVSKCARRSSPSG